jgi:putative DNA primase/helicase
MQLENPRVTITHEPNRENEDRRPAVLSHEVILSQLLDQLSPLNFFQTADLDDGEKLKRHHYIIISIEKILKLAKENKWGLCVSEQFVYVYNGSYWKQFQKAELSAFLGKAVEKLGVDQYDARWHGYQADLVKQFFSAAYLPPPINPNEVVLINVQNGTFVIRPGLQYLKQFDSEDFQTYQLPFKYDEDATAPVFEQYLDKVLPDKRQQDILAEYLGYVFIKQKTLKLEKSLILYGSGANGKSILFEIVTALLGPANVSNYSLQSLTNEAGYQRAKLANILLNYASEISTKMDSTLFKQLVSGEPIEARLPYGEPFMLKDYAKLAFNANYLPKEVEHNEAFFRRFIILHFGVTIPEDERDPELSKKIVETELPGVFNWILGGLKRLLAQKKFTQSDAVDQLLQQYKKESDTVQLFLEDGNYVLATAEEILLKTMYSDYRDYCVTSGYKSCSLKVFADRLRRIGYETHRKKAGHVVFAKKSFE